MWLLASSCLRMLNSLDRGRLGDTSTGSRRATASMKTAWFQARERSFQTASRFLRDCRRLSGVTGGPAEDPVADPRPLHFDGYSGMVKDRTPPSVLKADLVAEPADEKEVDMLSALPESERKYYEREERVLHWEGKSQVLFEELTAQYCFVGG